MSSKVIPAEELAAALTDFVNKLQRAFRSPNTRNEDPISFAQSQYTLGLLAVAEFIMEIEAGVDFADRFARLSSAMFDLKSGAVHQDLQPKKSANRKVDSTETWQCRILVVNALACLGAAGKDRSEAAAYIAKNFPNLSRLCRAGANLETSILNWDKSLRKKTVKNEVAADRSLATIPTGLDKAEYEKHAIEALRVANDFASALSTGT
jgi:hypothetical protein